MAAIDRTNYKRIQRSYYNVNIYNDTNDVIECKYSANMIVPLLDKPNQYEVSVVRASVPLDGIPISQVNIGFESWQVQFTNTQTNPVTTSNAYVQQFNPTIETYTDNTAFAAINGYYFSTVSIPSPEPTGFAPYTMGPFASLLIQPGYIPNTTLSNVVFSQTYINYMTSPTFINQYLYNGQSSGGIDISVSIPNVDIRAMCASQLRDQLYVVVYNPNAGFLELLTYITPTSPPLVNSLGGTFLTNTSITSISCSDIYLSISFQFGDTYQIINFNITGAPDQLVNQQPPVVLANTVIYTYIDSSNNYYQSAPIVGSTHNAYFYQMDLNTYYATNIYSISPQYLFVRFLTTDTWDNVLVLLLNSNDGTYSSMAYNKVSPAGNIPPRYIINMGETLSMTQFTPVSGTRILPSLTPNYQIWNYQTYLDQINLAIETAFNGIKGSDGWPSQEVPYLSYSDSKFSLNCGVGLASPVCIMSFNTRLWQRFMFNSHTNTSNSNYEDIQILNLIPNIVPSTPPTSLMITQPHNSNYRWFDITRIIVRSNKMSVAGDVELTNTSLLNITDFAVDTSAPDVLLQIYEPAILRYYQLYQTSPLNAVDVQLSYATRSGDIYPIYLTAGSSGSIKLLFRRSNFQLAL